MDKPTAIAAIARKLAPQLARSLTWAQFAAAVTGLDAADKEALLSRVRAQDAQGIGNILLGHVRDYVRAQALTDSATLLADDTIGLDELDKVL